MNLKHEMFWNYFMAGSNIFLTAMNLKHEMFWNNVPKLFENNKDKMNLKHEMFWNNTSPPGEFTLRLWTLNMKCFEIMEAFVNVTANINEP